MKKIFNFVCSYSTLDNLYLTKIDDKIIREDDNYYFICNKLLGNTAVNKNSCIIESTKEVIDRYNKGVLFCASHRTGENDVFNENYLGFIYDDNENEKEVQWAKDLIKEVCTKEYICEMNSLIKSLNGCLNQVMEI